MSEANYKKRAIISAFCIAGTLGFVGWAIPFFKKLLEEMNPITSTTTAKITTSTSATTVSTLLQNKSDSSRNISSSLELLQTLHSPEIVQKILENGCYCSWIEFDNYNSSSSYQMTLNDIDKICKDWVTARFCLQSSKNSTCYDQNNSTINYFISNDNNQKTSSCQTSMNSECQQLLCKVDMFHSRSLTQFLSNDNEFSDKNLEACEGSSSNGRNSTTRNF